VDIGVDPEGEQARDQILGHRSFAEAGALAEVANQRMCERVLEHVHVVGDLGVGVVGEKHRRLRRRETRTNCAPHSARTQGTSAQGSQRAASTSCRAEHPIVPVMIGDEAKAAAFAERLVAEGVYAVSFSYPVVPSGTARIRTQVSAAHSVADLDFALDAFAAAA
jgi:hypothetical protein